MSRDQQVEERCDEDPGKPDRTRVNEFPTKNHGSFWRKLVTNDKKTEATMETKVSHMPDTLSYSGPGTKDPLKKRLPINLTARRKCRSPRIVLSY